MVKPWDTEFRCNVLIQSDQCRIESDRMAASEAHELDSAVDPCREEIVPRDAAILLPKVEDYRPPLFLRQTCSGALYGELTALLPELFELTGLASPSGAPS